MKTAITLSLLPPDARRPFVLGPDLQSGFATARELGFDAVELFPPDLESLDLDAIRREVQRYEMPVCTIGTGGGAVTQGLTLTHSDPDVRHRAVEYATRIVETAAELNASAIVGSMQGRAGDRPRHDVMQLLGQQLARLGQRAGQLGQPLFVEPLNRYESDLLNTLGDAAALHQQSGCPHLRILADLFHMNIEESVIVDELARHIGQIGHVHFVDSNRWPAGNGHTDLTSIMGVLQQTEFAGYLAVEAFPLPDQPSAARQAARAFRELGVASRTDNQ